MKKSRIFPASPTSLLGVLLLAVLLLAACGGGPGDSWAGVSASPDQETVYVAYEKQVVALNPTSGATQWVYEDDGVRFFAVPVVKDDTIYVGDYKGQLHAISLDGERKWVYTPDKETLIGPLSLKPADRVIGGVAVGPDKVYFGMGSSNVIAVAREDGQELWSFETDHGVWATPLYFPADSDAGKPATLYVVSLDHFLYAINAETGKELWKKDLGGAAPGSPTYDRERNWLFVGTFTSEVVAVDLADGEIVDRIETEGWVWEGPAYEDGILYFGDLKGNLYAVRVTDDGFQQVWQRPVTEEPIRARPLVTEELVIVGARDKHVYAVGKEDGSARWDQQTKGEALTEMVFVPGATGDEEAPALVIAGTSDKDRLLVALTIDTGEERWHYSYDD